MELNDGRESLDADEPIQCLCKNCAPLPQPGELPSHNSQANKLHRCTKCKRYWIFGMFTDTFATGDEFEQWLRAMNREWLLEKSL